MSDEDRISRKIIILIFSGCLVLLVIIAAYLISYSPKTFAPVYSQKADEPSFESTVSSETEQENSSSGSSADESNVFPIKINTASSEELQLIPDIGPKTAKLIIDYRNEHGTIVVFRELLSIDGIGEKTVELLEEYCIIN